jgi:hypothetical protein
MNDRIEELENELKAQTQLLKSAARSAQLEVALELTEKDPHQFSSRPCTTCHSISTLIGRPFGCNSYRTKS